MLINELEHTTTFKTRQKAQAVAKLHNQTRGANWLYTVELHIDGFMIAIRDEFDEFIGFL